MSFFKELHYLFEWLEEHELTVGALSMWLVLMVFNNDCALPTVSGEWLWRVTFSVANRRIMDLLHCSERQLIRYRCELIECGRIRYQKGTGGKAGVYTLVPLRPNVIARKLPHCLSDKTTLVYDYEGMEERMLMQK